MTCSPRTLLGFATALLLVAACEGEEVPVVTACDHLAAHPDDPQRVSEGVSFDRIDPTAAVEACVDAVERFPDELRFHYQLARALHRAGETREALNIYTFAAEGGYFEAEVQLIGLFMREELPIPGREGVNWVVRMAKDNYAWAQTGLGFLYEVGRGVEQDYGTAARWYRKAAEKDEPTAQYRLGAFYEQGLGVDANPSLAQEWYERAAEGGFDPASQRLRTPQTE